MASSPITEDKVGQERISSVRRSYLRWARARPSCNEIECIGQSLTLQMPKTTGYCAICQEHLTADFPKDYPDEWKFCCSCLGWANHIVGHEDEDYIIKALEKSPTIKKIYERITVFGSERKK